MTFDSSTIMVQQPGGGPDPAKLVGTTLGNGRFEIRRFVGEGGFGYVYAAWDATFRNYAAVKLSKVPNATDSNDEILREGRLARILGGVTGHVVRVDDCGVDEQGRSWMAMEFLAGRTLEELMVKAGGPLPLPLVARLVDQIGGALEAAHEMRLLHRDVKPLNIMLVQGENGKELFKLLDFGIAGLVDASRSMDVAHFGAGTVEYMAPEQIEAAARHDADPTRHGVDPLADRADIYSFGVVLYRALTGRVPFPLARNDISAVLSCLQRVQSEPPAPFPPSAGDKAVDARTRRKLERLTLECLAKKPAQRPKSMAVVRSRFRRILDPAESRTWTRAVVATLAAVLLAAGGAFGWGWYQGPELELVGSTTVTAGRPTELHVALHSYWGRLLPFALQLPEAAAGAGVSWSTSAENDRSHVITVRAEDLDEDLSVDLDLTATTAFDRTVRRTVRLDVAASKPEIDVLDPIRMTAGTPLRIPVHLRSRDQVPLPFGLRLSAVPESRGLRWTGTSGVAESHAVDLEADVLDEERTAELTLTAVSKAGRERSRTVTVEVAPPEPKLPGRLRPAADSKTVVQGGLRLHERIECSLPGVEAPLTFVLVPVRPMRGGAEVPFYVLRDKVWLGLYLQHVGTDLSPTRRVELELRYHKRFYDEKVRGEPETGDPALMPKLPAVGVPASGAIRFCRWLASKLQSGSPDAAGRGIGFRVRLPSTVQWDTAAGYYDHLLHRDEADWKWGAGPFVGPFEKGRTRVAVDLDRPRPVGSSPDDIGPYGCRDMAGNGEEWTRSLFGSAADADEVDETAGDSGPRKYGFCVRGAGYGRSAFAEPFRWKDLVDPDGNGRNCPQTLEACAKCAATSDVAPSEEIGFRVVLEIVP